LEVTGDVKVAFLIDENTAAEIKQNIRAEKMSKAEFDQWLRDRPSADALVKSHVVSSNRN